MKTKLLSAIILMTTLGVSAQEKTVNLSMETGYTKDVYFKFQGEKINTVDKAIWDVAFLRESIYSQSIRFNQSRGISLFEASSNLSDWENINITNLDTWTELDNGTATWDEGGFMKGSATYGWGEYNPSNHHVSGSVIFVLKYDDSHYKKLIIQDYFNGYTLKYATFDVNTNVWSEDTIVTVPNESGTNRYNHYSLENKQLVTAIPADANWDLIFNKYKEDVGGGTMYPVTGVLQNKGVSISKSTNLTDQEEVDALEYSENINTIGYDWKQYSFSQGYIVDSTINYFVKDSDQNIYKMYFDTFEGYSTGNISFKYQDITAGLSIDQVGENVSFSMYPNPTLNKQVSIVYDVENSSFNPNKIEVYTLTGTRVHSESLSNTSGFYHHKLNLQNLNAGIYLVRFSAGSQSKTQKLIVQ